MSNECASSSVVADEQAISLIVDGVSLSVPKGATILDAAEKAGSHIPTLCFLKERSAISSCRICMVEVEGEDAPVPACSTVAKEGMVITTVSERLVAYRKLAMDLILSDHGLDSTNYCFSCNKNGACELQAVAREVGGSIPRLRERENASRCSTRTPSFRSILIFAFAANAVWPHAIPLQAIIRFMLQNVVCGHRLRRLLVPTGKPQGANRAATARNPVRRAPLP